MTRSEALLFLHLLAAAALLGTLLTVAVLATAGGVPRRLLFRSSLAVAAAALATVLLGEATKGRQGAAGAWLDAGSALAYAGLLAPSVMLAVAVRRGSRGRARTLAAGLGWAMLAVALATAFLMTAKPS